MTRDNKIKKYLPQAKSVFYLVQCPKCGSRQVIFSHAAIEVRCLSCNELLAKPTGGKAKIYGQIIEVYK